MRLRALAVALSVLASACAGRDSVPAPPAPSAQTEAKPDSGRSPYRIDGWEESAAPLIDRWLVLGPVASVEALEPLVTRPGVDSLFPDEDTASAGRLWRQVEAKGMGTQPVQGATEGWMLAHSFINLERDAEVRANLSIVGFAEGILVANGERCARVDANSRQRGVVLPLTAGWNRVQVLVRSAESDARFYLQLTGADGGILPLFAEPELNATQRSAFGKGFSPDQAAPLFRAVQRAIAALSEPYPEWRRTVLALRQSVGATSSARLVGAFAAIEAAAAFVVLGVHAEGREDRYREVARALAPYRGPDPKRSERWTRIEFGLAEVERRLADFRGGSWHLLGKPASYRDLWERHATGRRLLLDLLDEARDVAAEASRRIL